MARVFAAVLLAAVLLAPAANPTKRLQRNEFDNAASPLKQQSTEELAADGREATESQSEEGRKFEHSSRKRSQSSSSRQPRWVGMSREEALSAENVNVMLERARSVVQPNTDRTSGKNNQRVRHSASPTLTRTKRKIFGGDNRKSVVNVDHLPYSAIGHIPGVDCTGFLVAPNIVMTAAHCLYHYNYKNQSLNGFYRGDFFDFYRGRTCNHSGEKMIWKNLIVPIDYLTKPSKENDYGFVILWNSSSAYLPYKSLPLDFDESIPVKLLAYAYDTHQCMTSTNSSAKIYQLSWSDQTGNKFCHYCDTQYGSSGAPILHQVETTTNTSETTCSEQTTVKTWVALGVNNGHLHVSSNGPCNVGVRFRDEHVKEIGGIILTEGNAR